MIDLTDAAAPKSDQLNADDLIGGLTKTITITSVDYKKGAEQPVTIHYQGEAGKPYKPGKSMIRVLKAMWGNDAEKYTGRSLTLYRDDQVKFGGVDVGGIRISHMSHIQQPMKMALTVSRAVRKPYVVKPLVIGATPDIDDNLKNTGLAAASSGLEVYKQWFGGLSAELKKAIAPYHAEWKAIAEQADKEGVDDVTPAEETDFPGDR